MNQQSDTNFKAILNKFPSLEEYNRQLAQLREIVEGDDSLSYTELKKLIFDKTALINIWHQLRPTEELTKREIYRVRKKVRGNEDVTIPKTFSYPDPSFVSYNGRANLKGQSVFYGTHEAMVSILESEIEEGELFHLGQWKVIPKASKYRFTPILPTKEMAIDVFKGISQVHFETIDSHINSLDTDKKEHLKSLSRFLSEVFINEIRPYNLSSYIANHLFNNVKIDLLAYPSFKAGFEWPNMALSSDFAKQNLQLETVILCRMYAPKEGKFDLISIGKCLNNKITWSIPTSKQIEELRRGFSNSSFNEIIAKI